ncbi:Uncharacterised protein [Mycobacteroides abscessus subsp. bolletii]|nr:Uncharacterised protein [Mycobacteroides abscessus subsp. bolletii]SIJ25042.1 Uncharacterised protein [Mycobacteroides abscessus subsp. bolletii]SKS89584.1 Uncharacterised protein [Mycobacteroides abscessus subsp. bolletii]SKT12327.1 Uncharacterised protein [Mycobacteroides abscessus subsp. bolletii]SLD07397.1 Uncharacterised protein [Mycobacteroides abscessus subsp. bolletii]
MTEQRPLDSALLDVAAGVSWKASLSDGLAAVEQNKATWIVVVDQNSQPLGALFWRRLRQLAKWAPNSRLSDALPQVPATIVADATTTFQAVFDLATDADLEPDVAVVVVADSEVRGVATARRLRWQVTNLPYSNAPLPGYPKVPAVMRRCRYRLANNACGYTMQFRTRPPVMPPCPNLQGLSPHSFVW